MAGGGAFSNWYCPLIEQNRGLETDIQQPLPLAVSAQRGWFGFRISEFSDEYRRDWAGMSGSGTVYCLPEALNRHMPIDEWLAAP